ncbi:MAG: hypothetical protein DMF01_01350 [Verrucomicrobia bacterium]|nr:MAG: hypothetical protein DMF01_01350 [Verrucomicrobiota bacterium]
MSRFTRSVLRSKTFLLSFPRSTLPNNKKPRDAERNKERRFWSAATCCRFESANMSAHCKIIADRRRPPLLVKNMKHKLFRGLGAILFKEFIVVWRDPLTLFFFFFPPLIEMIAFGYALDNDVKHMAMIVLNEDRTVESRQLIDRFVNTESFRVVGEVQNLEELKSAMRIQTGLGVALTQSLESLLRETGRKGMPIDVRPQMLYNPAMRAPNFFVPGVIGVVLQIGTTVAAAMALVRERERGTLEQLLVSPLSRSGLMLGKLVPYLCIGMTMAAVLFTIMRFVFFVPIEGNIFAMMFSTLVYVFALLSLGLLVGTMAENQMQALQMSMVFLLPSVFFSGFIFPRETMPWIFYALGALFPTTYFIALMRAIILRGANFFEYWPNLLVLILMSNLLFILCALRFRRKIA